VVNQDKTRQQRLIERQALIEDDPDPSIQLLAAALDLMIMLRDEGVELDDVETALIDHIGVFLKEYLGRTTGSGMEVG